ncbi:hypothetical protein B0H14DRAFT_2437355, partial [Mycena olivaceomarginata]
PSKRATPLRRTSHVGLRAHAISGSGRAPLCLLRSTARSHVPSPSPPGPCIIALDVSHARWPLHKDDTLFRSGRPTGLNIYASFCKNG